MSDGKIVNVGEGNVPDHQTRNSPQILGAKPAHGKTEIYDKNMKQEPVVPEVHKHVEHVTQADDIRRANLQEGQADVRVHVISKEDHDEWQKVKKDA